MGGRDHEIELSSVLDAQADVVWRRVTGFAGINDELMPLMRMTSPARWRGHSIEDAPTGERVFRSWLLLLGVVPIDYDDICIAEIGPGHRFLERSEMMSASVWEHERTVTDLAEGSCRITDRVRFVPRRAIVGPVLRWFVPRLFAHRHRRLRRRFAGSPEGV